MQTQIWHTTHKSQDTKYKLFVDTLIKAHTYTRNCKYNAQKPRQKSQSVCDLSANEQMQTQKHNAQKSKCLWIN